MAVLKRSLLVVGLVLVAAGCGGSGTQLSAAAHGGILFTYERPPTSPCAWACGDDIYVWTRGSAPLRLTDSPLIPKGDPQWSPDGKRIAWAMVPAAICKQDAETCGGKFGCVDEIYVADSGGGQPVQVSPAYRDSSGNTGCSTAPLGWSPDGKQLLFTRSSATAPSSLAILTLATGTVQPLHLPDFGNDAAWGKPGIAYVYERTVRTHRPPYGRTIYQFRVVAPSPGGLRFVIPIRSETGAYGLAWSSRGELATIQGKRLVLYSSTGRRVADFSAPLRREAPALGSTLVWSPDGTRLLLCLDPFGGLGPKAHHELVNSRQKLDRYPAPVPYLVDRDGTHWQRLQLPNPQKKETLCSATSWR